MNKILKIFVTVLISLNINAQQDYLLNNFMHDRVSINPASAGTGQNICVSYFNRMQWLSLQGITAPNSTVINASIPAELLKGGLGLTYVNDVLGTEKNNIIKLSYNFNLKNAGLKLNNSSEIRIGLSGAYYMKEIGEKWFTPQIEPGTGVDQDNRIPFENNKKGKLSVGAGLYYFDRIFYGGISATNINQPKFDSLYLQHKLHIYALVGAKVKLKNEGVLSKFFLRPNLLYVNTAGLSNFIGNVNVQYQDLFWLGASYSTYNNSISPMAGLNLQIKNYNVSLGYSMDINNSVILKNLSKGTHDFFIKGCYLIEEKIKFERYYHPRGL